MLMFFRKWTAKLCIILEFQWFSKLKTHFAPKIGTQKY